MAEYFFGSFGGLNIIYVDLKDAHKMIHINACTSFFIRENNF